MQKSVKSTRIAYSIKALTCGCRPTERWRYGRQDELKLVGLLATVECITVSVSVGAQSVQPYAAHAVRFFTVDFPCTSALLCCIGTAVEPPAREHAMMPARVTVNHCLRANNHCWILICLFASPPTTYSGACSANSFACLGRQDVLIFTHFVHRQVFKNLPTGYVTVILSYVR